MSGRSPSTTARWMCSRPAPDDVRRGPFLTHQLRRRFNEGRLQDCTIWIKAFPLSKRTVDEYVEAYGADPFTEKNAVGMEREARTNHNDTYLRNKWERLDHKYATDEEKYRREIVVAEAEYAQALRARDRYFDLKRRVVPRKS